MTSLEQLTGRGVAAGGRIVVTAQSGHLVRAELHRGVMQLPLDVLADELAHAVNSALDDVRPHVSTADARDLVGLPELVDFGALARQLAAVRDQVAQEMDQVVSALRDAAADLASEGKLPAGAPVPDFSEMLQKLDQVVELLPGAATGGPPDHEPEQPQGTGQAGGLVRAVAVPPGRITHLDLEPHAIRVGPDELAGLVVTAVNVALDSLDQAQRLHLAAGAARRAELNRHLEELRGAAMAQMQDFASSTSWLTANLRQDAADA